MKVKHNKSATSLKPYKDFPLNIPPSRQAVVQETPPTYALLRPARQLAGRSKAMVRMNGCDDDTQKFRKLQPQAGLSHEPLTACELEFELNRYQGRI